MNENFKRVKANEAQNKKKLLEMCPRLTDRSGIYILLRKDENGIKYAYVGQAKHVLTRLAQHMTGYQHIDLSIKKHGFMVGTENPYGWRLDFFYCSESELDEWERHYIKLYADKGFQLRNKTAGGQGKGKVQIDEYRPSKTYRDGLLQGRKNLARELSHIAEKHLEIRLREGKEHNKVSQKALEKFMLLMNGESEGDENE